MVWAAALDERVRCVVSVVGVGDGRRWMRSVRRPDEWHDLLERAREDREQAVDKRRIRARPSATRVLMQDRASAALSAAQRANNPDAVSTVPASFIDETLSFHADWVVGRIAPRPLLLITTEDDRLVPPEESRSLFRHAGEPKKLVVLKGYGHYDVYAEPAFGEVMAATLAWYRAHLPPRALDAPTSGLTHDRTRDDQAGAFRRQLHLRPRRDHPARRARGGLRHALRVRERELQLVQGAAPGGRGGASSGRTRPG